MILLIACLFYLAVCAKASAKPFFDVKKKATIQKKETKPEKRLTNVIAFDTPNKLLIGAVCSSVNSFYQMCPTQYGNTYVKCGEISIGYWCGDGTVFYSSGYNACGSPGICPSPLVW